MGADGTQPVVCGWEGDLFKGVATPFDEANVPLRSPCFLATGRPEALHYASTLPGEDADRRILVYGPTGRCASSGSRPASADWAAVLDRLGVRRGSAATMAMDVLSAGYDGLMFGDGDGGYHVVLGSSAVVDHAWTEQLAPSPSP